MGKQPPCVADHGYHLPAEIGPSCRCVRVFVTSIDAVATGMALATDKHALRAMRVKASTVWFEDISYVSSCHVISGPHYGADYIETARLPDRPGCAAGEDTGVIVQHVALLCSTVWSADRSISRMRTCFTKLQASYVYSVWSQTLASRKSWDILYAVSIISSLSM
jgi:hypothetical protein